MLDFLDVILEAERPASSNTKIKVDNAETNRQTTDYTNEEDDTQDDDETPEETDDTDTSEESEDEESTDYTEQEDESDPEEDGADPDGDDDGESTDYTEEGGDEDTDSTEESSDESSSEENPEQKSEDENNRILLEDFSNLFYLVKNTITKLSNIDKSNILINKIVTQISSNLGVLKKNLFDFITFDFPKGKYVTNLYKYNYFLEAFKINVEMLKKISVFIPN
jgi:hypothetical protein